MTVDTSKCKVISVNAMFGELVGMFLFVMCGAGSAMSIPHTDGWTLQVALSFGLAITALAYALGHHSGAQFNCAVTFGLVLAGKLGLPQGLMNTIAQLVGATLGAVVLKGIIPGANDNTFGAKGPGLACNMLGPNVTAGNAFLGEFLLTMLLVLVVLETACSKKSVKNGGFAALAIGLAVFLGHSVLIPIDGCSINPTRSFGTAFVAHFNQNATAIDAGTEASPWEHFWIYIFGPLLGAVVAAGVYHALRKCGGNKSSVWLVDGDAEALPQDEDYE